MTVRTLLLAGLALALAAASARALYVETPLALAADRDHAEVGDRVRFDVSGNASAAREWAGRAVVAYYGYDPDEGRDRSAGDETPSEWTKRDVARFALGDAADASFAWTVPDEVDRRNVVVTVETEEGKVLAVRDLAVGDAIPVLRATAGPAPEAPADGDAAPAREVPAAGALLAAAVAAGAAALARRR